ncbi:MAG TPA: hypothetical protein PK095_24320, partial [Myxococcota bacterium]|nr:hypothetical protein [Myxococcota bacterium]
APRGELHRASAGKIVFGSSPIAADAKDHQPERLRIDQPIHHRAFQTASAATLFAEADGATCGLAAWRQFVATL